MFEFLEENFVPLMVLGIAFAPLLLAGLALRKRGLVKKDYLRSPRK
jgi:hypothetical protein